MKNLINGFSHQEIIKLTGVSDNSLRYWVKQNIVNPQKIPLGNGKRSTYFYSFTELVEIKAIMKLRSNVPVRMIKAVKSFISDYFESSNISDKPLIVLDMEGDVKVYLQNSDILTQITGKHTGQTIYMDLAIIPSLQSQFNELITIVKSGSCESLDMEAFKQRMPKKFLKLVA
jgi:DNA-binding transcriptional MerR regulator